MKLIQTSLCFIALIMPLGLSHVKAVTLEIFRDSALKRSVNGLVWQLPGENIRTNFVGNQKDGYDVIFESQKAGSWQQSAAFPKGQVWTVYSDWRDSLYADPHSVKVQKVEALEDGRVKISAEATIAGEKWTFADVYSLKNGMIRIDRSFNHPGNGTQSKVTLESRIRLRIGTDQRFLMPGVLYNNNPNAILTGTKISTKPGGLGLYEEHRLPVPMVNIESFVDSQRTYGSIITKPSKITQGHKGNDHWWSIGIEYGQGYADLLSLSGPVSTNGKKSQVYGHRNGFNIYDDAYLDIQGPAIIEKTLYIDLGSGIKTGYSFRETLWKAFDIFQPTETPNVPFSEAMSLVAGYASSRFEKWSAGAAGYPFFTGDDLIMYGWVGGNLGIAYGMLEYAEKKGDTTAYAQAMETIRFFVNNSRTGVDGLYYGDYFSDKRGWSSAGFYGSASGISSRQFGENLEHMASLVELGKRMKLPEAEEWFTILKKAGDFLLRSKRYQGMFPRGWTSHGEALGLTAEGVLMSRDISSAGSQCVCLLSRLANLTGETKYSDAAATAMDAYWHEFGETLDTPPWGATLDAGGEDKEAGWSMMRAALETYVATKEPRFLQMAKDIADWTLTWMYFYDTGLKPESGLLYEYLHTVGWTFISTQNQEIDVWGYFMAPDFYRLGMVSGDERYKMIGKVLFQAATQTISRPGAMFGSVPGEQAEHYNHSNCTYVLGGPELWRGSQQAMGISWAFAGALYGGSRLTELAPEQFSLGSRSETKSSICYEFVEKKIKVDGDPAEWKGIKENIVGESDKLWIGVDLMPDRWNGKQDLSFRWRGSWQGNKLHFLVEVTDDHVIDPPLQPITFLNDNLEIYLDPQHLKGTRKETADGKERLKGYEIHFGPTGQQTVIIDDIVSPGYPMDKPQNNLFRKDWKGEMAVKKTATGYIMEIAFSIPGLSLKQGTKMGIDLAVCDDDGASRKAFLIWSGNQGEPWKNMDGYPEITLVK